MSYPPPHGPPYPTYGQPGWQAPPNPTPYPPAYGQATQPPQIPVFVPGAVMMPVPVLPPMPQMPQQDPSHPTYVTNYIYHGQTSEPEPEPVEEPISEIDYDWVTTTSTSASYLADKAVVGGKEGWDESPLWVIRAWHNGELLPGKFAVKHNYASILYNNKETQVENIDVLCAKPHKIRWVPAADGSVPAEAIIGGKTSAGETLYIGRVRHKQSLTPGRVHPSQKACFIGFGGVGVSYRSYGVLCLT